MQVVMVAPRTLWQDAGRERVLNVGDVVDLPDGVAEALLAQGVARRYPPKARRAPETKAAA